MTNNTKVTEPVSYASPIGAILNGRIVQIIAHGDQEGSSPVFQYCNPTTGRFEWAPQSQFHVLDGRFPLNEEALSTVLSQLKGGNPGGNIRQ